jgi:hypothetical protein
MTSALLRQPVRDVTPSESIPEAGGALHLERTDIVFADVAPGLVGIEITVRNLGRGTSAPTPVLVKAAPLGAFVPWQPLTVLSLPALSPGEAFVLRTRAVRPRPTPLGDPGRLPPRRLLTALGMNDERSGRDTGRANALALALRQQLTAGMAGPLPADLHELLGRGNPHWAGNLNVFLGRTPVERHVAQALRVYPGRPNLAMFVLGTGPDAYAFHLEGTAADWEAKLYDLTDRQALELRQGPEAALPEVQWIEMTGHRAIMLALVPPEGCPAGSVEVHVRQRSSGRTAVVEFSLDPNAAGPGCFVV